MKLSLLAAIAAGASLTQVGASPIRLIVVTGSQEVSTRKGFRFGHPVPEVPVAKLSLPQPNTFVQAQPAGRRPCGKAIKDKAIQISNAFRTALGLPVIETVTPKPGDRVHGGMVHILPFVGTPPMFIEPANAGVNGGHHHSAIGMQEGEGHLHPHHHFHHHAHKFHQWSNNFWMRIHNALMALGPWEGRAVAFVFGCGIGVLLRMFWVLTVVTYRSIWGDRDGEYTQVAVIEEYVDAEDIVVPPPSYTILDKKQQVAEKDGADN